MTNGLPCYHGSDYTKGVQLSRYITIDGWCYNHTDQCGISYLKDRDVIVENRKHLDHKSKFMKLVVNLRVGG